MKKSFEKTTKSKGRGSRRTTPSTLRLATAASSTTRTSTATADDQNGDKAPETLLHESHQSTRLDNFKRKTRKGQGATSCTESLSEGSGIVQIGAFSVTNRVDNDAQPDLEGLNGHAIEVSQNDASGLIEAQEDATTAIEAHVVDESSASFFEQDKQKYEQETREKLLAELTVQATQAEVVVIDAETKGQGVKFFFLRGCFCITLVLIVAITAGTVISRKTSSLLTVQSSTEETSDEPFLMPTSVPSLMPTSVPRNNTYCTEAQQLVLGEKVSGSLEDSIGTIVVFCEYSSIASYAIWAPGRWYVYHGEGFPVVIRTDNVVDIHVYRNCDGECHKEVYYPNWQNESTVLWEADLGTDYLVLVSAPENMEQDSGYKDFLVTIETNDSLENAFGPLSPGLNTVVGGSTGGSKVSSDVPACGSASVPSGPGVWYSVIGNGKTITASTCGSPTGLDTQISVLTAENLCVDGNDDFCSGKSQVAWSSNADEIYYVHVHGKNGAEGTFILQVTTEGESLAEADFCANAQLLEIGATEPVNLLDATMDPDMTNCTQVSWITGPTSPVGNFYKFIGTGQPVLVIMNLTLPFSSWNYEINAVVLTGTSCSSLECIHTSCTEECQLSTNLGQNYYIYTYYIEESLTESDRDWLNGGVTLTIEATS